MPDRLSCPNLRAERCPVEMGSRPITPRNIREKRRGGPRLTGGPQFRSVRSPRSSFQGVVRRQARAGPKTERVDIEHLVKAGKAVGRQRQVDPPQAASVGDHAAVESLRLLTSQAQVEDL